MTRGLLEVDQETIVKILSPKNEKELELFYDLVNGISLFTKDYNTITQKEINEYVDFQNLFKQYEQLLGKIFDKDHDILHLTMRKLEQIHQRSVAYLEEPICRVIPEEHDGQMLFNYYCEMPLEKTI